MINKTGVQEMNLETTYLEYYNNLHLFDDKQTVPFRTNVYNLGVGDVISANCDRGYYEDFKIIGFSKCWKERPETNEQEQNYKITYRAVPTSPSPYIDKDKGITIAPNWIYSIHRKAKK